VYFGRAVALIEGIGARYVPGFNPVAFTAPVIMKHRRAVLAAMGDDEASRDQLGILLGKLAGDITRVVITATREIAASIAVQLPALLAPLGRLFEPA
jgi:hypothetical protein